MTYRGRVQQGVVVLPMGTELAEGTEVLVEAAPAPQVPPTVEGADIWHELLELEGSASELPEDLAERHDHYRRQRLER